MDDDKDDNGLSRLSINQLMRKYPRERLLVKPVEWSPLHLELLGCSFVEDAFSSGTAVADQKPVAPPFPSTAPNEAREQLNQTHPGTDDGTKAVPGHELTQKEHWRKVAQEVAEKLKEYRAIRNEIKKLASSLWLCDRRDAVLRLMRRHQCFRYPDGRFSLSFQFEGRHVVSVVVRAFMFQRDQFPSVGYVEADQIAWLRRTHCPPLKAPADAQKDPFIVAVLIAMAQAQCRKLGDAFTCAPVHLFVHQPPMDTPDPPASVIHLYSANVSKPFLDKLSHPGEVPAEDSGLLVRYTAVPFVPHTILYNVMSSIKDAVGEGRCWVSTGNGKGTPDSEVYDDEDDHKSKKIRVT